MNSDQIDDLIQKYILNTLTESEATELAAYLKRDEAVNARRKLRLALRTDSLLQEAAAYHDNEDIADNGRKKRLVTERIIGLAGSLLLAMIVGLVVWNWNGKSTATEDLTIATIRRIEGQGSKNDNTALTRGSHLYTNDRVTLEKGLIEIVYKDTGVHAIATAPLSLTIHNSELVYLNRGDLKLHVPPQGIGFVVKTAQREITDLGTTFVVSAEPGKSHVLVLDGLVSVGDRVGSSSQYYTEGDAATFTNDGELNQLVKKVKELPEITWFGNDSGLLPGRIYTLKRSDYPTTKEIKDILGEKLLPLIHSEFKDRKSLNELPFTPTHSSLFGIAGAYSNFPKQMGLDTPTINRSGWLAWYQGKVLPPKSGRYRFWGYGDNSLLVAIDGKTVFEGGRFDSAFRECGAFPRKNHPAWPCLHSRAGVASGAWFEVGDSPVQLDLIFGEQRGALTYGLLLIEHEASDYEKTYYGQPRWPIFLTSSPNSENRLQLEQLNTYLEEKLLGSFTIDVDSTWEPQAQ